MRRIVITCLTLVAAALLVLPAAANAATSAPAPQITRVKPMRVSVGGTLTILGRRFKSTRTKNTVIFRAGNGRTALVKPRRATTRKLVLVVPESVARLLRVSNSRQQPTRLKLRVLAGKFSQFTPRRLSPVVTAAGDGDGTPGGPGGTVVCDSDSDHDNDLLPNSLELSIGTDPCLADTDNDQLSDGWEYYSARDLNIKAVPYPGKRPFPNALDPSDGGAPGATFSNVDFDGDGLTTLEEYRAWRYTGSALDLSKAGGLDLESPLGYSDGTKYSRASAAPSVPAWRGPSYGLPAPGYSFPATFNLFGDGAWRDDERDADGDGLSNFLEAARGPGRASWWAGFFAQDKMKADPWPKPATTCGQEFGAFSARPFAELDMADPDVDGDTLLDGEDDQDNDDVNNIDELYETQYDLDGDGSFTCGTITYPSKDMDPGAGVDPWGVNAFNPCAPNPDSRTCSDHKPFG
jgi:IPT/TIG domain